MILLQILESDCRVVRRNLLETCVEKWRVQFRHAAAKQHEGKLKKDKETQSRKRKRTLSTNQRTRQTLQDEVAKAKILGNYYMVCGVC